MLSTSPSALTKVVDFFNTGIRFIAKVKCESSILLIRRILVDVILIITFSKLEFEHFIAVK